MNRNTSARLLANVKPHLFKLEGVWCCVYTLFWETHDTPKQAYDSVIAARLNWLRDQEERY